MKKFQSKTAQLTLGAILLAVFIILHIIIPGGQKTVQSFLMVLTFLPVTIYARACGIRKTLVMVAAGGVLSALLLTPEVLLAYAIPALLLGLVAGACYGKTKRLAAILIFSVMQLVQTVVEIYVYYVFMGIDFADTYARFVTLVYDKVPAQWLTIPMVNLYLEDLMICLVPCIIVVAAGAKGIVSFLLIKLLNGRLTAVMGPQAEDRYIDQTKFDGPGISSAYFCAVCVCMLAAALPVLGIAPYHFVFSAALIVGLFLALLYTYYFYSIRIRAVKDPQKRLICSGILVVTLPLGIFLLPWVEMYFLKQEK